MNNRLNRFLNCGAFAKLAVGVALVLGSATVAQAQAGVDNQGYQSNEKDGLYGDAPAGLNPLDLMHRAQQSGRSAEEFNEESQLQIDNSVSDFKRLQQQRILEQQQQNTTGVRAVPTINTVE